MSYKVEIFITNEEEGVNTQISASLEKAETALIWAKHEVEKLCDYETILGIAITKEDNGWD